MLEDMEKCIEENINSFNSKVRVLVLKSEGKHFTVGLDIATVSQISNGAKDINAEEDGDDTAKDDPARKSIRIEEFTINYLQKSNNSIEKCRVPVICAISGYCLGAGIDVSSACDIRLCSRDTKFAIKEIDIGVCADFGTIQRM